MTHQLFVIAVTECVPLDISPFEATDLWDGKLDDKYYCPVIGALLCLFIWWTALIVLAVKGLLFHRNDPVPISNDPDAADVVPYDDPLDEFPPLDLMGYLIGTSLLLILFFLFWPMFVAEAIDRLLKKCGR